MSSHQIYLFVWGVIKSNACTQVAVSSTLGSPVKMHRHMDTNKPHTPALMRETSTNMFYLPFATKSMKRVTYRRWNDTWRDDPVLNPHCSLTQAFCGLTPPTTKSLIFQSSLKLNQWKMLKENPWKELTPNEQSRLFPHVDKPLVNRCFLSSHLAVVSRDD